MIKYFCTHNGANIKLACEFPNECPICHNKISPNLLFESINEDINLVSMFFTCPSCGKGFISHYRYDRNNEVKYNDYAYKMLPYLNSFPNVPNQINFDDCINNLSQSFCEIYNQAYASEIYNLNQLSGIGYRKALEFLIKDYCIYKHPDKVEDIKSSLLGQVISNYVDSTNIKNLAKISSWIGNDETHYVRKFEDKDINDLKRFIKATVAFITYDLTSDEACSLVNG